MPAGWWVSGGRPSAEFRLTTRKCTCHQAAREQLDPRCCGQAETPRACPENMLPAHSGIAYLAAAARPAPAHAGRRELAIVAAHRFRRSRPVLEWAGIAQGYRGFERLVHSPLGCRWARLTVSGPSETCPSEYRKKLLSIACSVARGRGFMPKSSPSCDGKVAWVRRCGGWHTWVEHGLLEGAKV